MKWSTDNMGVDYGAGSDLYSVTAGNAQDLGEGHTKHGYSISAMDDWVALVDEYDEY